ncbi:MAG: hypothetical protein ACQEWV_15630 [Bacillota bacterium]
MALRLWKSDEKGNDNVKDHENRENTKKLEDKISELQFKLNQYDYTFTNLYNDLQRYEEKGIMSSNKITDLYERLQSFYEKDEVYTKKINQLENELQIYKEEIKAHQNEVAALERRIEELQTGPKDNTDIKITKPTNKIKKKKNIEFANKSEFFQQGIFPETIQRVYPQERTNYKRGKNRKIKETSKNRFASNPDLISNYFPKGQKPVRMTTFNPLKYS